MSRQQRQRGSRGGKQRQRRPTLNERINIINTHKDIKSFITLAKTFKVDVETVRKTIAEKEKYLKKWEDQQNQPREDIPLHLIRLGQLLPLWVERCKYCKIPITVEFMRRMSQTMEEEIHDWTVIMTKPWLEFFGDQLDLFMETHPAGEEGAPSAGEEDIIEAIRRECRWKLQSLTPEEVAGARKAQEKEIALLGERQLPPLETYYKEHELQMEAEALREQASEVIEIDSAEEADPDPEAYVKMEDDGEPFYVEPLTEVHEENGGEASDVSYVLNDLDDIRTHFEALKHLKLIENYALKNENFTIVGLVNQIENILRDEMRTPDPQPEYDDEHSGEQFVDSVSESAIPTEIRDFMNNMGYEVREIDESELLTNEGNGQGSHHGVGIQEPPEADVVFVKEERNET